MSGCIWLAYEAWMLGMHVTGEVSKCTVAARTDAVAGTLLELRDLAASSRNPPLGGLALFALSRYLVVALRQPLLKLVALAPDRVNVALAIDATVAVWAVPAAIWTKLPLVALKL